MINIQNLTNIYEQQTARRKKLTINVIKIALCVFVAPVVAYLFCAFLYVSFNPAEWTREGREVTLWIAICLWWLSLFPLLS